MEDGESERDGERDGERERETERRWMTPFCTFTSSNISTPSDTGVGCPSLCTFSQ